MSIAIYEQPLSRSGVVVSPGIIRADDGIRRLQPPSQTLASNIGGQKRTRTNIVGNLMQAQLRSDSSREATLTGFEPVLPP